MGLALRCGRAELQHLPQRYSRSIAGVGLTEMATGSFGSNLLSGRLEIGSKQTWRLIRASRHSRPFSRRALAKWIHRDERGPARRRDRSGSTSRREATPHCRHSWAAQVDTRFLFRNGMALSPYARVSWVHEFKPDRAINASFIALPAAAFSVDGPRAARDAARIDAGAKLGISANAWLFASFDGEFSSRSQSYAGKGGARVIW